MQKKNNQIDNFLSEENTTHSDEKSLIKKKINTDVEKKKIDHSVLRNSSCMLVPIDITIELSKKKITIQELLQLSCNSILELEDKVDEPLNIFANNSLIALGELVIHKEKCGVRIIKLIRHKKK